LDTTKITNYPLFQGPCRAVKKAFGFNKETGRCEAFSYGGVW